MSGSSNEQAGTRLEKHTVMTAFVMVWGKHKELLGKVPPSKRGNTLS